MLQHFCAPCLRALRIRTLCYHSVSGLYLAGFGSLSPALHSAKAARTAANVSKMASPAATVAPVQISYNALVANDPSLSSEIQRAFDSSPDALGLLIVSDLPPQFPALRRRLLHLADRFAALSEATREQYARPPTFSYGWSHGKEVHNGKPDRLKGSFYNNPKEDLTPGLHPGDEPTPNVWPKEPEVAGFEGDLSSLRGGPGKAGPSLALRPDRALTHTAPFARRGVQGALQAHGRNWRAGRGRVRCVCR